MRKSFYTWLMTQRNPKSNEPVAILADLAFEDSTFPKHTDDFEEVTFLNAGTVNTDSRVLEVR